MTQEKNVIQFCYICLQKKQQTFRWSNSFKFFYVFRCSFGNSDPRVYSVIDIDMYTPIVLLQIWNFS